MNAYLPTNANIVFGILLVLLAEVIFGFVIQRLAESMRGVAAWTIALLGVALVFWLGKEQPPGFLMVVLILGLLYGMKAVVAANLPTKTNTLNFPQWIGFTVGWFGMRPAVFEKLRRGQIPGAGRLIRKGAVRLLLGVFILLAARFFWDEAEGLLPGIATRLIALAMLLPALSLILHFGFFNILAGIWRWFGVPVGNLFNAPFKAVTLAEFWGRRWNIAFVEMTALAIYRPMKKRFGEGAAKAAAFLFSGLAHELAISVPVNAGYGLPTTYFGIQALAMAYEKKRRLKGRIWTAAWILIPLPLLFHPAFIKEIILPLIK